MSPRLSAYLDGLRFSAALVVLLSHFAYPRLTGGDYLFIRELNLGSDAVILFFVLSGFVIAYAAAEKDSGFGRYLFNRATRLYSVAVPAVLLTLVCDRLGAALAPEAYAGWWYNPAPAGLVLAHGLTFSGEWALFGFRLGTNGPYWSLSYEVAYYLLFGVALYWRGPWRIVLLALGAILFSPKVLALAPAWLLGVAVYRALAAGAVPGRAAAWAMFVLPPVVYAGMLGADVPAELLSATVAAIGSGFVNGLRFSNEFLWNGLIGILVALNIYGAGALLRGTAKAPPAAAAVKWLAGASFSIYVVHYPVLQFLGSLLPATEAPLLRHLLLLVGTLAVCLVFAQLFERRLAAFRRGLVRLFGRRAPALHTGPAG